MANRQRETVLRDGRTACDGKVSYATKKDAARAARNIRRYEYERVEEFRCVICKAWHVGRSPDGQPKRTPKTLDTCDEPWYGPA